MSDNVFFIVELEIQPGQLDELRDVSHDMVDLARKNEPGTLNYEYFLSDDGTICHIYERYDDLAAVLEHSKSFPENLGRRGQQFRPTRLTAYGAVTPEIQRERIDPIERAIPGFHPLVVRPLEGFAR